jgi:hypothetical protein
MAKHHRLPEETIYLPEPPLDADRSIPSRAPAGALGRGDWFVVLRCGAGRHQRPPRVGEVSHGDVVWWAPSRGQGRAQRHRGGAEFLRLGLPAEPRTPPASLRFPCPERGCSADWNVATDRLEVAYWRAVAEGRRELTLGVDL